MPKPPVSNTPIDASLSIHRQVSVEFIRNSGALAVRVNPNSKSPGANWNPRGNDPNISESILREANKHDYTDNLGAHFFGPLVDIDIDSDAPILMQALEKFLPPSSHIWGHSSRPRTHRVYQLKADYDPPSYPILRTIKKIPEVKIEVRGGRKESGLYCVVPGSVHPEGESILWSDLNSARMSVAVTEIDILLRSIRLAGAITLLAPYWIEGSRNELCMALSGFLYRTAKISEAIADPSDIGFQMTEQLAESFLDTLIEVCNDDSKDYRSRKLSFQRTWQKAAEGENVIAGATLAKITGDAALLNKLYLLLSDSPDISILDEFSSRFAIWSGPGIIIDIEAASLGAARPFMTRQQFINSFGHKWIESNGKRKLVADILFGLQTTQRLAGVTFEPGAGSLVETHQGKKINQWCGFAIEPYNEPVKELDIAPFLTYIHEVICSNDERIERWVLAWLSHIFQEPSKKAGTALVLVGLPGIGKSFLGEHFLIPIIGSHSVTTSSADRAAQGFNALFDNKIYVQCDEAISSRQRITAARLKSLITDPTLIIEPKGIDPYEKPNHMRMLFTSNEIHDAVFLSDGIHDRRYTVIQVSDIHRADSQYWVPLARWSTNQTNLSKVHRFLLDYSYQDSFIRFPLSTAAKVLMQEHSMSKFDQWLSAWVSRRHPLSEKAHEKWYDSPVGSSTEVDRSEWPHMINYAALTRDLWLDYRIRLTENQIRRELMRRGFKIESIPQRLAVRDFDEKEKRFISQRIYLYAIPDKKAVELYLAGKYGVPEEKEEFQEFEGISLGNGKEF